MLIKRLFFIVYLLCGLFVVSLSYGCNTDQDCPLDQYCKPASGPTERTCTTCNKPADASWDSNGERQGTGENSCPWTLTCSPKTIICQVDNISKNCGTHTPDQETVTGYGANSTCTYDNINGLTCNETGGPCDRGYHPDSNGCKINVTKCGNNNQGYNFYINTNNETECLYTHSYCNQQQSFDNLNDAYICDNKTYGQCYNNNENCVANGDITQQCDGTVNGNITITQTHWISQRDYSNCTCTRLTTIQNGTGTETCYFDSSGHLTNDCRPDISTCDAGYYEVSSTCAPVERGYYSDGTGTVQTRCPFASTSDGGPDATAATKCYFTRIRDNNNKNSDPWEIPVMSNNRAYITQQLIGKWNNTSTPPNADAGN